jgi:hypothetical protein
MTQNAFMYYIPKLGFLNNHEVRFVAHFFIVHVLDTNVEIIQNLLFEIFLILIHLSRIFDIVAPEI